MGVECAHPITHDGGWIISPFLHLLAIRLSHITLHLGSADVEHLDLKWRGEFARLTHWLIPSSKLSTDKLTTNNIPPACSPRYPNRPCHPPTTSSP